MAFFFITSIRRCATVTLRCCCWPAAALESIASTTGTAAVDWTHMPALFFLSLTLGTQMR